MKRSCKWFAATAAPYFVAAWANGHALPGDPAGMHHLVAHPPAGSEHGPMFVLVMVLLLVAGLCALVGISRAISARPRD